ncbi:MAG: 3-oxoadipate enol-lactonase [Alphaproteobacteria bacterium]|nr:3-oxoadipate enol-lactonase [Alphaproteobacteria bacterium]
MPVIETAETMIHVAIDGREDAPPLMLSNSLGVTLEMWRPQIAALSERFRVIRYDPRGHGRSSVPPAPYSVEAMARDALAVLDALQIDQAHFCGLSLGGMVGQWLGAHAPHRLNRLVLANTACHYPDPGGFLSRIQAVQQGGMAAIADSVIASWLTADFRARESATTTWVRAMLLASPVDGYLASCDMLTRLDQRDMVKQIRKPTLVIIGRHDAAFGAGEFLVEVIPGATGIVLEAAHLSNVEQGGAFTDALIGFLTKEA